MIDEDIVFINLFRGNPGGGEIYLARLIKNLLKLNLKIRLISPEMSLFSNISDLSIERIEGVEKGGFLKGSVDFIISSIQIKKLLRNYKGHVIINGDRASLVSLFLGRSNNYKLSCIKHMLIDGKFKSLLNKFSFFNYDNIVTISNYHKENYIIKCGSHNKDKIVVIHNSVDTREYSYSPVEFPSEKLKLCFIASLEYRKGILDLLSVVKNLNAKGENITLNIFGEGELKVQINEFIKNNNLNDNVFLKGYSSTISDEIKKCHVTVLPSYDEGLPLCILESLSVGRIVIATNIAGIPEVITDGYNGFLFQPGEVETLELILKNVINNPNDFIRMSNSCRDLIVQSFDNEKWLDNWLGFLKNELTG